MVAFFRCADLQAKPEARFVCDVTLADKTVVAAGATLIKTWRVQNQGTVAWPAGCRLLCVGGMNCSKSYLVC